MRTPLIFRLLALGLLAVGCVLVAIYRHEQAATDRWLSAAVREQARVIGVDGDGSTISLRLPSPADPVTVGVIDTAAYPVGAEVPVLVDRRGTTPRVVLVAEAPDDTLWPTGGLLASALAATLIGVDLAGGRWPGSAPLRRRLRSRT